MTTQAQHTTTLGAALLQAGLVSPVSNTPDNLAVIKETAPKIDIVTERAKIEAILGEAIMTPENLEKKMSKFAKESGDYHQLAHKLAMQALSHAFIHDNSFHYLQRLYDILTPNEKDALKLWAGTVGPIRLSTKEDGTKVFKLNKSDKAMPYNFEKANSLPFYQINTADKMKEKILKIVDLASFQDRALALVKEMLAVEEGKKKNVQLKEGEKDLVHSLRLRLNSAIYNSDRNFTPPESPTSQPQETQGNEGIKAA